MVKTSSQLLLITARVTPAAEESPPGAVVISTHQDCPLCMEGSVTKSSQMIDKFMISPYLALSSFAWRQDLCRFGIAGKWRIRK